MACKIAIDAVNTVRIEESGRVEIDIKRYAKVEKVVSNNTSYGIYGWGFIKVPGGAIEESEVLQGVMINKDVTHAKMRRRIENPRIILLDCNLEYKKGESQVHYNLSLNILLSVGETFLHRQI